MLKLKNILIVSMIFTALPSFGKAEKNSPNYSLSEIESRGKWKTVHIPNFYDETKKKINSLGTLTGGKIYDKNFFFVVSLPNSGKRCEITFKMNL